MKTHPHIGNNTTHAPQNPFHWFMIRYDFFLSSSSIFITIEWKIAPEGKFRWWYKTIVKNINKFVVCLAIPSLLLYDFLFRFVFVFMVFFFVFICSLIFARFFFCMVELESLLSVLYTAERTIKLYRKTTTTKI